MNRDAKLHERIRDAERDRAVEIGVELRPLNQPDSPVYSMWENALPAFVLAAFVILVWFFAGWVWALAAAASGVILLVTVVNMLVMTRLRRRALALALADEAGWSSLWEMGVLSLRLPGQKNSECSGADGDWRGFAIRHLGGRRRAQAG